MRYRRIKFQLAILIAVTLVTAAYTFLHVIKLPAMLFGVGRYTVRLELPRTGGLYSRANVTYRGSEVGRVQSVQLTSTGVEAVLSLKSGIHIPSDLKAEVHSETALGEQYVELLPRTGTSPALKDGDVIALANASVPPDINGLLTAVNTALQAVPRDNLKTVIDESYTAVGGLGPELSRLVKGSSDLAIEAHNNLDPLLALIDQSQPVLDSQTHTSDAIQQWASHMATVTTELQTHDEAFTGMVENSGSAVAEAQRLVERLQPTLPVLLANLVSVGQVGVTYRNDIEQILVLFPQLVANHQAAIVANANTKQDYAGFFANLNLNLNLPAPCTTGYLPSQQRRNPTFEDAPDLPAGLLYCRVPKDSQLDVRGARNVPCETAPGKSAPTVKLCESAEQYVPLNDGYNWKGDPNATVSGQDIPQLLPGSAPEAAGPAGPPLPIPAAEYNPATGTYIGPDGQQYTQSDLAQTAPKDKTWQTMLLPPPGN
ncbi:MlaD family protein [Mycobacterium sp. 663a-19]|uniref:MlaD family protein n=1 Tax=Mycobacterium sp. 663a-19 TaxID=2986148 RepID=UPI002D1F85C2|nr:MlaD family protein [Mycobacterium sp. 663a-19]MEB3980773.1 MlaD family protein [Mycobacterium sp. 663a-19]